MSRCLVGLGANLGDPLAALRTAADTLDTPEFGRVSARSSIYRSAPVGPPGQNDYLNAVLALDTSLSPDTLLSGLQALENRAGRLRAERWGPRTLDLDLLLYDDLQLHSERLTLPHPRIAERNFVLLPLAELLGPQWSFVDGRSLETLLAECPDNPISKTGLEWQEAMTARSAQEA
jgi:2-amino-4-hydroxy-6-hydroxymethyldihydropteridine diphosphokinase